ncbi:MAG: hypothetical protein K2K54_00275 [Lachnospiraceae bacterium]|nr:hypothetical protein [Lachnospiraceae bacterium]
MRKDNFGICLSFYAVLGFVLALLGHTTLTFLLLGFVIVIHKDQWLTMQLMQAFFLSILSGIVSTIIGIISPIYKIPILGTLIATCFGIVTSLISLIILVMAIVAISKVAKEQDANLPLVKAFAEKAFGLVKNVTYTQAAPTQNQDQNNFTNTQN